MLQLMVFFSADKRVLEWKGEVLDLAGYVLILPAACIGAWLGSAVGRHLRNHKNPALQHALPTS